MGYSIAEAAARHGHEVCLVSGPVSLPCPPGVERIAVQSALEMLDAAKSVLCARSCQVLIGVAAVSDSRPRCRVEGKPAKSEMPDRIELVPNPDILATLTPLERAGLSVGFALESMDASQGGFEAAVTRARAKLDRKGLDAIVLNALESMEGLLSQCWWLEADLGPELLGSGDKSTLASAIVDRIEMRLQG